MVKREDLLHCRGDWRASSAHTPLCLLDFTHAQQPLHCTLWRTSLEDPTRKVIIPWSSQKVLQRALSMLPTTQLTITGAASAVMMATAGGTHTRAHRYRCRPTNQLHRQHRTRGHDRDCRTVTVAGVQL